MSAARVDRRRIAVVGAGVSGLSAALLLQRHHDVTLFERDSRAGGHAWTIETDDGRGGVVALDVGFMVLNEPRYPHFVRLLEEHGGVELGSSEMSFSYCDRAADASYAVNFDGSGDGGSLRSSALMPILGEVMRFVRAANRDLDADRFDGLSLGSYLDRLNCSQKLREIYVSPLGAALWSCPPDQVLAFPAKSYLSFFRNHGLLVLEGGLSWRHVRGGSARYVGAFLRALTGTPRLGVPVRAVRRVEGGVDVVTGEGSSRFDEVVLATHADEAARLLVDADERERAFLGAFRYQRNQGVLHTDDSVMPARRDHWASWNFEREAGASNTAPVCVSYHLNRLQGLQGANRDWFVSLNRRTPIKDDAVIANLSFDHPIFDAAAIAAQSRVGEVSGRRAVHFCGAHLGYGFHEDGVRSAVDVARALGVAA
jgi:predicted NAD/FAD-binding protein